MLLKKYVILGNALPNRLQRYNKKCKCASIVSNIFKNVRLTFLLHRFCALFCIKDINRIYYGYKPYKQTEQQNSIHRLR